MLIRNFVAGDAEHWSRIVESASLGYRNRRLFTPEEARKRSGQPGFETGSVFFAEEEDQIVGAAAFDPQSGQVTFPWCRPGFERLSHPLLTSVLRAMSQRKINRAFAAYPTDWTPVWDFFEDYGFVKVREVINYRQSIGDLPTMFQRPGLNITPLKPGDLAEIEQMGASILRLEGERLSNYWLKNPRFGADALFVLRRKDGSIKGVGIMLDDPHFNPVEDTDPKAADFRFGSFGTEGYYAEPVNGLFSFIAPQGKETEIIGQDLLWYATSRASSNSFEYLAGQVPSDVPHLKMFFDRYFRRENSFLVFHREIGSESKF